LTVDADPWPPEDPEREIFEELIWSVMERRRPRQVLVAEQIEPELNDLLRTVFDNQRIQSGWLSHVRILCRDECHEAARLVDRWAPASLIPLEILREKDPGELLDWFSENRPDDSPSRLSETVAVRKPSEEDRIRMELLDRGTQVIVSTQHYFSEDGELLMVERSLLTTQHLLTFERNLPCERGLRSGEFPGGG
jgi:hypothetical protein